jgi:hypothetical protein
MILPTNLARTLLAAAVVFLAAKASAAAPPAAQGLITAKGFLDIGSGTAIADLTNSTKFPNNPDVVYYQPYFEWNATGDIASVANNAYADNYGAQMLGYFYPPATGDYVFYFSADDNARLFLSTDDSPANKKLIAQETGWSNARSWDTVGSGTLEDKNSQTFTGTEWATKDSANGGARITLTKGKAYYIEAIVKEGGGGDNMAVAVMDPESAIDSTLPIPGQYLATIDKTSGPIKIIKQPLSQTVDEGDPVTFSVEADGTPPYTYQWMKNGVAITDATNFTYTIARAHRTDNAKFKAVVTGPAGSGSSDEATLTVNLDTQPPAVVLASTSLGKTVKIEYDEWVDPASATNKANYSIPNLTITDASISEDNITVTLGITGSLPANFEVTLGGIKDFGGNVLPANTKVAGYTTGLSPNMVAYWPMDSVEGTKTPDVISGYDMNLDALSAADLVNGRFGKCFKFDNARKTMLYRVNSPGDGLPIYKNVAFTVSLWVNGPTSQPDRRVFSESSSKSTQPLFNIGTHNGAADGTVDSYIRNDGGTFSIDHAHSVGEAFDDSWHHLVWVQNSNATTRAALYIDGVKDESAWGPVWPLTIDTTTIGGIRRATTSAWFTGLIDDVAVWSRALDPEEVNYLYTKGTPTPPPKVLPLVINSFTSDLPAVAQGDTITLRWDVSKDASAVEIQPNIGDVTARTSAGAGSMVITVTNSYTYQLTAKRGKDSVSKDLAVAAIADVASGWSLLDNFDRYPVGELPAPWGVSGAGNRIVDVKGNHLLANTGAGLMAMLPLSTLTIREGEQHTLFGRFYLDRAVAAAGIDQLLGFSDKGIRGWGDANADLGPGVWFQNPDGALQLGAFNGNGSTLEHAVYALQPGTVYNLWINFRNDSIEEGDLYSVFIAKDGEVNRTELFKEYRSSRNPNDTTLLGPTLPDLDGLVLGANTANSIVYYDDFYLTKSGYSSTVPRAFGFTSPAAPTTQPTLSVKQAEGTVQISWTSGTLESSTTLTGGWTTVANATSPYTVTTSDSHRFYRTKQ